MLLSNADIKRIETLGFPRDLFVDDVEGWLQLKNQNGHCVFHDGMKCLIYTNRPEGCALYPVIYDMDNDCAVIDEDCPYGSYFSISQDVRKQLFSLVSKIESERMENGI